MTPSSHLFTSLLPPTKFLSLNFRLSSLRFTSTTSLSQSLTARQHKYILERAKSMLRNQVEEQTEPASASQQNRERLLFLIKSCTLKTHLFQIHAHITRIYQFQDPIICYYFLSCVALTPFWDVFYARRAFSQISSPSLYLYNTMIRAYSASDSPAEGFYLYREMRRKGVETDSFSSLFALKSCIRDLLFFGGAQLHGRIVRDGYQSDSRLLTILVDFYSSCEMSEEAGKVFDEIPLRDIVAWNALISCFMQNKRTRDALAVFDAMQRGQFGCEPNDVTCLLVVQACTSLGALEFGERVHHYIRESGYDNSSYLCNSLIAMYSRCGCLDKAYEVFKAMPEKNVATWGAMIHGLAVAGHGRDALEAFQEMERMGVAPDDKTFTGVLLACSYCGLVDRGIMLFDCMTKEYGIMPTIHHYGCMVSLLGRAGLLDQAYQLIMSMGVKPDATIWRTLLGSCRIHGHFTLGELVIKHLIELKALEVGNYVLLLNIYFSAGEMEKVKEVRKLMKEKGVQTRPACSTVELKGVVHDFAVDDVSHPKKDEIYETLNEINQQLKIAGYVADMSSELGAEQKGYVLPIHSEKLAIAFGVLETPPGTTIRVAKNLKICIDCHNFAKLFSSVYNRDVIIVDRTHSHRFREGRCSCNDYW